MKIYTNKKYQTIAVYAAVVIAVNVLLVLALNNVTDILESIYHLFDVLQPVTWGLIIAFLTNPLMVRTSRLMGKLYKTEEKRQKASGFIKVVSVIITELLFLGIVTGIVAIVVPELIKSIMEIFDNAGSIAESIQKWINKVFRNYPALEQAATKWLSDFNTDVGTIYDKVKPMLENILSGAWGIVTVVKNFLLGLIVSVYMLCSKEKLLAQFKKIIIALTKKRTCEKIMAGCEQANTVFSGFITGKIIDSIIIGLICFIGLTIMSMPYATMISVIIGVTNIIPFFGPLIGAVPTGLLILLIEPKKCVIFIIFVVVLQQFDGNILGPKILGDSTGLPGFWVLISLFLFGGLFGFGGMILAVPTTALLYSFIRGSVEEKLRKKKLPTSTAYYMDDVQHLYKKPPERTPLTAEELLALDIPSIDEVNEVSIDEQSKVIELTEK
ncbi:MAG: AI-2E family transporter [Ruminococcus sp.]|uniref:Predicted PurR-regulated permease PerM n=1 Tax=Ruminococcus albus TaxID=1264 RepID=A0A1H7FKW5_RUMAL|nr:MULTISPECIES: AI-2E family transporter [Ruminococcus]MBO4867685.1 AI-2E family transporter [Ruminococcus sp.]SEK25887.1 Predicted PurR-regulated permease PerM [Ruminococcus albus]